MSEYKGPFWIFVSSVTGMPLAVEKCDFKPSTYPSAGTWEECQMVSEGAGVDGGHGDDDSGCPSRADRTGGKPLSPTEKEVVGFRLRIAELEDALRKLEGSDETN